MVNQPDPRMAPSSQGTRIKSDLITMLVFALFAWGLVALSRVFFASNESGRQRFTATRC
ncbi:MAG TPA: hypothetical protein VFN35_23490 [Ktedonobacteraceae bacterium]|nr:hypothetical protein [Ktedonobacteraceae bacterium]